jgi:tetratricopeptide (TPR) repeat protein
MKKNFNLFYIIIFLNQFFFNFLFSENLFKNMGDLYYEHEKYINAKYKYFDAKIAESENDSIKNVAELERLLDDCDKKAKIQIEENDPLKMKNEKELIDEILNPKVEEKKEEKKEEDDEQKFLWLKKIGKYKEEELINNDIPKIVKKDPQKVIRDLYKKSLEYIAEQKYKDAEKILVNLEKKIPNNYDINLQLGLLYNQLNFSEKALPFLEKANSINKDRDEAKYGLINAYYNLKRFNEAIVILKEMEKEKKDDQNFYRNYAIYLKRANMKNEAVAIYKMLTEKFSNVKLHFDLYVNELINSNLYKEALLVYQDMEVKFDKVEALNGQGICYYNLNDIQKAIELFTKVLTIDPNNITSLENMIKIHLEENIVNKAKSYIKTLTELDPKNVNIYVANAELFILEKNVNQAKIELNKAENIDKYHHRLSYLRGLITEFENNYNEALRYYMQALAVKPHHADSYYRISQIYKKVGDYENCLKYYEAILQTNPDYRLNRSILQDKERIEQNMHQGLVENKTFKIVIDGKETSYNDAIKR